MFGFGATLVVLRGDSWLCTHSGIIPGGLRGPYGSPGLEFGSATHKANALLSPDPEMRFCCLVQPQACTELRLEQLAGGFLTRNLVFPQRDSPAVLSV